MLTEQVLRFIEGAELAFVASTDGNGNPHLAVGKGLKAVDADHVAFENWFCQTTLRNVNQNPNVALSVCSADAETGYQLLGVVTQTRDAAILDGFAPEAELPGTPQTLTQLVVRVREIMAFSAGVHTDLPVTP